MLKSLLVRTSVCALLVLLVITAASGRGIDVRDPIRLADGDLLKAVYFFPHWWDPWKSDDAAIAADLAKMKDLGLNTVCLDHEVSQAIDREWYWLDREYRLAEQEDMKILPWLQLQCLDRKSLMKFSHLTLKEAVDQDGSPAEDCVDYRDPQFVKAFSHYVSVYLDRYADNPALLRVQDGKKSRPVVGLMLEVGWRSIDGRPLSFDDDSNAYFRKWMKASHHDLKQLNTKWGTDYKSFDEIDPRDTSVFNYEFEDKENMPLPVREHVLFRARIINDAMREVIKQVRKRHKDALFVAEIAYPIGESGPDAAEYRWNNANEYKSIEFADIVLMRTQGNTSSGVVRKNQDIMVANGKGLILAQRLFSGATPRQVAALALDCAISARILE